MDSSLITFLSGLRIPTDLAAFVAVVVIFLLFVWRLSWLAIDKFTQAQTTIAATADTRLASLAVSIEKITDKFQNQVDRLDARSFESQVKFQEQLRDLTDSHVAVSREHIAALSGIQAAFQGQAIRLEHVERMVGELGRGVIPGRGRTTTTKLIAEEVTRVDPPKLPDAGK